MTKEASQRVHVAWFREAIRAESFRWANKGEKSRGLWLNSLVGCWNSKSRSGFNLSQKFHCLLPFARAHFGEKRGEKRREKTKQTEKKFKTISQHFVEWLMQAWQAWHGMAAKCAFDFFSLESDGGREPSIERAKEIKLQFSNSPLFSIIASVAALLCP